jgi:primosomal protein N''
MALTQTASQVLQGVNGGVYRSIRRNIFARHTMTETRQAADVNFLAAHLMDNVRNISMRLSICHLTGIVWSFTTQNETRKPV